MAVVAHNDKDVNLLARLMRAEAEGDGQKGMLMVGNVGVNRIISDCLDFKDIRTVSDMVHQRPGGFEATQKSYFYQRARDKDIQLARQVLKGWRYAPATNSLWFFRPAEGVYNCPAQWFNQANAGRYKSHCFFFPTRASCPRVY